MDSQKIEYFFLPVKAEKPNLFTVFLFTRMASSIKEKMLSSRVTVLTSILNH